MDDQRVGRVIRALRRRLGWRQVDLARKARCSQRSVSRAEAGHLPSVPMLRRMLAALDASLALDVRWRAGALDRLLDEAHAAVVGTVAELLTGFGWSIRVEVTYSEFGERGSIDVLAFWEPLGILLVIEVKTDFVSVESVLRKLDEKVRLARTIASNRFGWQARHTCWLVVMPGTSTLRRRTARNERVLARALPMRGAAMRRWLHSPSGVAAGLLFLSPSHGATAIRGRGGPERVRVAKVARNSRGTTA